MKKILAIIFTIVLLVGCTSGINYRMRVKKLDIRKTYTNEYVFTEVCTGANAFGIPLWEKVVIEKADSLSLIMRNNYEQDCHKDKKKD